MVLRLMGKKVVYTSYIRVRLKVAGISCQIGLLGAYSKPIYLKSIAQLGNNRLNLHPTPAILKQRPRTFIAVIIAEVTTATID